MNLTMLIAVVASGALALLLARVAFPAPARPAPRHREPRSFAEILAWLEAHPYARTVHIGRARVPGTHRSEAAQ